MDNYRNELDKRTVVAKEDDVDTTEFILADDVKTILDDIEKEVNAIKNKLEDIKGLTEIDVIHDLVDDLSRELY